MYSRRRPLPAPLSRLGGGGPSAPVLRARIRAGGGAVCAVSEAGHQSAAAGGAKVRCEWQQRLLPG